MVYIVLYQENLKLTVYSFPLWAKGVPYFRFEYAIFLLNKDIEQVGQVFNSLCILTCSNQLTLYWQLMESQSCIVLDLRHTLPNLKYLLYVTTASKTPMS